MRRTLEELLDDEYACARIGAASILHMYDRNGLHQVLDEIDALTAGEIERETGRDAIAAVLTELCRDGEQRCPKHPDVVMVGDCDELTLPSGLTALAPNGRYWCAKCRFPGTAPAR